MKRKYLIAVLACSLCLTAASVHGMAATAASAKTESKEETEEKNTDVAEAETEAKETETTTEKASEAETEEAADETETETKEEETEEAMERPTYKALDFVTLGDYKDLVINQKDLGLPDVYTDEEINEYVESSLKSIAASVDGVAEELTEGTVEEGDTANIDYVGKKDGEAFDGGTAEGYDLTIGSGLFIEGFEEGLVGAKIGDTVDLNLTVPKGYKNEDLAGQEVVFTVTVNSVKRVPEITDELVSTVTNGDFSDLASYTEYVRSYMDGDLEQQKTSALHDKAFSMLKEASEINGYPEGLKEYTEAFIQDYYEASAERYGMELPEFLEKAIGITEEEFQKELVDMAEENMDLELYFNAILETEKIEITDADYELMAQNYGYESFEAMYESGGDPIKESAYLNMIQAKALEALTENVTVQE